MRYQIWVRRTLYEDYIVDADSEEQAVKRFLEGKSRLVKQKSVHDYFGVDKVYYYFRNIGGMVKRKLNPPPKSY